MAGFLIYWSRGALGRELLYFVDGEMAYVGYFLVGKFAVRNK